MQWSYFNSSAFARDIRMHRQDGGYTQSDIADAIGVTSSAVSLWEHGCTNGILVRNFISVCNLFDMQASDYFEVL